MKNPLLIAILVSGGVLLSGCQSIMEAGETPGSMSGDIKDDAVAYGDSVAVEDITSTGSVIPKDPSFKANPSPANDERTATSLLQERVLYFEYNKSLIRDESIPVISAHADFLNNNSSKGIVLGGHADSRGSNEYNLALGQRRADAVRDMMLSLGVSSDQLESLSFGEESPAALGDNDAAWRLNRRVEIRYTDE